MDKHAVIRAVLEAIHRDIQVLRNAAADARDGATSEESRPENDKDTRAVEAAYLAGAQAERAAELQRTLASVAAMPLGRFDTDAPVKASALVTVSSDEVESVFLLAPDGGGVRVTVDGTEIQVLTPRSPLGRAMLGKRVGDVIEVRTQGTVKEYEITRVD